MTWARPRRRQRPRPAAAAVQFNFEQADIRLVTQIVGKITGKKFVVPESVTGKVTILTQGSIPVEEVYPLYLNMLEASGYTVAERGGVYQVAALPGSPALASGTGLGGGLVTKLIPLKNVGAAEVKKSFEPLVRGGKEGALEVFLPSNHLIVTDTAANVARLEALVAELDKPGSGSVVEMVPLKFASAEAVAEQLRATYGATDSAVNKINQHFQQVAGGTGDLPTDFTVVAAPQANSLILVGLPMQIAETKRIIEKMDVENPNGFGRLNAIFLKYLSAEEAVQEPERAAGQGAGDGGRARGAGHRHRAERGQQRAAGGCLAAGFRIRAAAGGAARRGAAAGARRGAHRRDRHGEGARPGRGVVRPRPGGRTAKTSAASAAPAMATPTP